MNNRPSIVVGIPTLNRSADVRRLLECVAKNTLYPDVIIVCDQSDDQNTKLCIEEFQERLNNIQFVYILINRKNAVHARNLIMDRADCDYLVLLDDDALIDSDFFATLIEKTSSDIHVICIRKIESRDFGRIYESYEEFSSDALLVSEYEYRMTIRGRVINTAYMISFNTYRRKGYIKLNRIKRMVHDFDSKSDRHGDLICGFTVLSKDVYRSYQFDYAMGEGYTLLEDNEFSAQISGKYTVQLFGDLWAYHNKDLSDRNRMSPADFITRHYENSLYIFSKHCDVSLLNRILFLYSRIGFCVINIVRNLLERNTKPIIDNLRGLAYTFRVLARMSLAK